MLDVEVMENRRVALGLSQHEAARRAGLTGRQRWHNIESGRNANVTVGTLDRIAKALDCDPRELIKVRAVRRRSQVKTR